MVDVCRLTIGEPPWPGGISMQLRILFGVLFLLVSSVSVGTAEENQESPNLVQREMIALDSAFKTTVDSIVLNEPGRIGPAFNEVNKIREQVEHAVEHREKITLPRNQKRFREFVRLDNKFHHELEVLLKAAKKNKMRVVQKQTHRLLDACVRCHTIFRK
jgi:hypothetical protein